jgi:hypothetical protein
MSLLLKQAQIFTKLVANSAEPVKIDDVIKAQEKAKIAAEDARKLHETYSNQ